MAAERESRVTEAAAAHALDFERPVIDLERKIEELVRVSGDAPALRPQIRLLEERARELQQEIFADLSAWQKVQLSRHPARPYTLDYIERLIEGFVELHGDRRFADDPAIVAGFGTFEGTPVLVLGHQKGRSTKEKVQRNFGQPKPEGYRKAMRLMELAARMKRPVVCLIDTQGAYPGIDAEERGQAEAIAKNLEVMAGLPVPIVCAVIGEGGSGGALALGVANRILMMEYATYSVISPEGCASILWRDDAKKPEAAEAMKMTATDLLRLGIIDEIIPEAPGGAHRDHDLSARQLGDALRRHLADLLLQSPEWLRDDRYRKFRGMGAYIESGGKDDRPDGDARGEGGKSDGKPGEKPAPSPPAAE
jgi:acetyl-CoA carboxylase carboxyl transferase subunit alpha